MWKKCDFHAPQKNLVHKKDHDPSLGPLLSAVPLLRQALSTPRRVSPKGLVSFLCGRTEKLEGQPLSWQAGHLSVIHLLPSLNPTSKKLNNH